MALCCIAGATCSLAALPAFADESTSSYCCDGFSADYNPGSAHTASTLSTRTGASTVKELDMLASRPSASAQGCCVATKAGRTSDDLSPVRGGAPILGRMHLADIG